MAVEITHALREALEADGLDPAELIEEFRSWKALGPSGEDDCYLFGKDAAYVRPKAGDLPYSLRHVHLVPLTDADQLGRWDKAWERYSRRTSDRHLVYVDDKKGNFLLIYILPDGDAHRIAEMRTPEDKETMEGFAHTAAAFLDDGSVIA